MNKEDFDSEVSALFEEDSVLAQAVIELQQRRKIAEAHKAESNVADDALSDTDADAVADSVQDKDDTTENVCTAEAIAAHDASDANETELLTAVSSCSVDNDEKIDTALHDESNPPVAKKKANGKKTKAKKASPKKEDDEERAPTKPIASTVQLLEFVSGEKTVRPEGKSPLFDFGFPTVASDSIDESEKIQGTEDENARIITTADNVINAQPESTKGDGTEAQAESTEDDSTDDQAKFTEDDGTDDQSEFTEDDGQLSMLDETDELYGNTDDVSSSESDSESGVSSDDTQTYVSEYVDSTYFINNEDLQISIFESDTMPPDSLAESTTEASELADSAAQILENVPEPEDNEESERYAVTDTDSKKTAKPAEKSRFIDGVFDFLELFIFSLAAVLLITTFFFRHSVVDGSSMEQTLFNGEHIIISNLFYEPERGDIIVFDDYSIENDYYHKPLVKRVIGIPGDTVEIVYDRFKKRSDVYVNGEKLDEDYVYIDPYHNYRNDTGSWVVGEGEVFVMGDHRNNSDDSRVFGPIRIDSILGKALIRFYPFDKFGKIE